MTGKRTPLSTIMPGTAIYLFHRPPMIVQHGEELGGDADRHSEYRGDARREVSTGLHRYLSRVRIATPLKPNSFLTRTSSSMAFRPKMYGTVARGRNLRGFYFATLASPSLGTLQTSIPATLQLGIWIMAT
jgi:hypothetical protein